MKNLRYGICSPTRLEKILGGMYLLLELFLLPGLLVTVNSLLPNPLSDLWLNLLFFCLNFCVAAAIFHKLLGRSFKLAFSNFWECLQAGVLGYVAYSVSVKLLSWGIVKVYPSFINANDASINGLLSQSPILMAIAVGLMVPVTEECFYRGLLFGGLHKTNRILAYAVSTLVFAAIHVLGYIGSMSTMDLLLAYLQYLPAGLWLAWTYEKSGSLAAAIGVHAAVNLMQIYG